MHVKYPIKESGIFKKVSSTSRFFACDASTQAIGHLDKDKKFAPTANLMRLNFRARHRQLDEQSQIKIHAGLITDMNSSGCLLPCEIGHDERAAREESIRYSSDFQRHRDCCGKRFLIVLTPSVRRIDTKCDERQQLHVPRAEVTAFVGVQMYRGLQKYVHTPDATCD